MFDFSDIYEKLNSCHLYLRTLIEEAEKHEGSESDVRAMILIQMMLDSADEMVTNVEDCETFLKSMIEKYER